MDEKFLNDIIEILKCYSFNTKLHDPFVDENGISHDNGLRHYYKCLNRISPIDYNTFCIINTIKCDLEVWVDGKCISNLPKEHLTLNALCSVLSNI
jgi:hypothetical protein